MTDKKIISRKWCLPYLCFVPHSFEIKVHKFVVTFLKDKNEQKIIVQCRIK